MANPIFTYLSNLIGVPYDQILLVGSVLSAIPIGLINYLIISPKFRLYYGLITGSFVSYSLYGSGNIHPFIGGLFTYLFMKYFGRKKSAFYVFIITFLHLAFLHLYYFSILLYAPSSITNTVLPTKTVFLPPSVCNISI